MWNSGGVKKRRKKGELFHLGLFMECIAAVQPELIGSALVGSQSDYRDC